MVKEVRSGWNILEDLKGRADTCRGDLNLEGNKKKRYRKTGPKKGIQSLGWEDPLEKGMSAHSNVLAWRFPLAEEPCGGYSPWGCKESDRTEWLTLSLSNKLYVNSFIENISSGVKCPEIVCSKFKSVLKIFLFRLRFKKNNFIDLFLTVMGFLYCTGFSPVVESRANSVAAGHSFSLR